MANDPIFILGTERSGSNLLRLILNSHSRIAVPHPPHVVRYFAPLEALYGDLTKDRAFRRLVDDILRLLDQHIYQWDIPIDAELVARTATPRSAFGVYVALQDQYRAHTGKARWGCKSTFMVDHIPEIRARFPGARMLFLVRDPRDVAVSSRKSVFSTFHPYHTAQLWRDQQASGLRWLDQLPAEAIRLVHYERLVAEPEASVREICAFLDEDFEPGMLRFFDTDEARKSASLAESWGNTGRPVSRASVEQWRTGLTPRERLIVEHIAGAEMTRLGYAPVATPAELASVRIGVRERGGYELAEGLQSVRIELRSVRKDKNVWRRWARAWTLAGLRVRLRASSALARSHGAGAPGAGPNGS
ncbi:MAG: sulfotransferase [Pseudomonadota bacterium]|nr:sulfotransferase [Pseudomonadota bacterium]